MLRTLEATLDPKGHLSFKEPQELKAPQKVLITFLEEGHANAEALLSEETLAKDWLKPEEDEAWRHLQEAK